MVKKITDDGIGLGNNEKAPKGAFLRGCLRKNVNCLRFQKAKRKHLICILDT